jgi:hypothetical protein
MNVKLLEQSLANSVYSLNISCGYLKGFIVESTKGPCFNLISKALRRLI